MHIAIIHWTLNLAILNTLILCCTAIAPVFTDPKPQGTLAKLFYITAYISQKFVFSSLLSIGIALFAFVIPVSYIFIPVASFANMAVLLLLIANSVVFAKYRFNINRTILTLAFGKGGSEVVQASKKEYLLFISLFVFVFAVTVTMQTGFWRLAQYHYTGEYALPMYLSLLLIYLVNQTIYFVCTLMGNNVATQYSVKLFFYDRISLYFWLYKLGLKFRTEGNELNHRLRRCLNQTQKPHYPLKPIEQKANPNQMNILMIVVDAWRFDMLCEKTMPNTYQFAQQAEIFNNHWSSGNTTQPGIFGMFYSLPPTHWNSFKKYRLPPVLMRTIIDSEYHAAIYASATLVNPPFNKTIFSNVEDLRLFTPGNCPLERDKQITTDMIQFIESHDDQKPFFGFLFYDSAHGFYAIPNLPETFKPAKPLNHITASNKTDPEPIKNMYCNALHSIDQEIGRLIERLKQDDLLDNTCIIITGDHGQEFNDLGKNYWEHPSNFARYQVKVPFIMHYPGRPSTQHDYFTTHYDLAPTLMKHVLGVTNCSEDYAIGTDLLQEQHETFLIVGNYTNFGIIDSHEIINLQRDGHYQVYDKNMNHLEAMHPAQTTLEHAVEVMERFYQAPPHSSFSHNAHPTSDR